MPKRTLINKESALNILNMTSDTLAILNHEGVCEELHVGQFSSWFISEDRFVGKNIFNIAPSCILPQLHSLFITALNGTKSFDRLNIETKFGPTSFRIVMHPFDHNKVLCQYCDVTTFDEANIKKQKEFKKLSFLLHALKTSKFTFNPSTQQIDCIFISEDGSPYNVKHTMESLMENVMNDDKKKTAYWFSHIEEMFRQHTDIHFRYTWKGSLHILKLRLSSSITGKDNTSIFEGFVQDISESIHRDTEIQHMQNMFNHISKMICGVNPQDGTIVYANQTFRQKIGMKKDDDYTLYNIKHLPGLYQSNEVKDWNQFVTTIREQKQIVPYTRIAPFPLFPTIKVVQQTCKIMLNEFNEETMCMIIKDITQQEEAEKAITHYSHIINETLGTLPASITIKDANDNYKYIYHNKKSLKEFGIPSLQDKNDFDMYSYEEAMKKRMEDEQVIATGKEVNRLENITLADGTKLIVEKHISRMCFEDGTRLLVTVKWDVTETEKMKQALKEAYEKANESDKMKSEFLANISHEVRTPLNAILGFTNLLMEENNQELQKEYRNIINKSTQQLVGLMDSVLELSRIEAEHITVNITPLDIHSMCQQSTITMSANCSDGVTMMLDQCDEKVKILGDKHFVMRIIYHLLSNACKFTEHGSIHLGYKVEGNKVGVYVNDTGIGIPKEVLPHIFERFYKSNTYLCGLGLGLSTCKIMLDAMNGEIKVETTEGKGTTFTFYLPLVEE